MSKNGKGGLDEYDAERFNGRLILSQSWWKGESVNCMFGSGLTGWSCLWDKTSRHSAAILSPQVTSVLALPASSPQRRMV